MKIQHVLGSAAAFGIAAFLILPTRSEAWTPIGGSLGLTQRDYRVYNNFSDPTANDNLGADANFPGYVGVALAVWKANIEWSSRLHGTGNGDSSQPAGLGSGGGNFDPSWQGYAAGVGTEDENIVSEIAGSSGSVLAYTETPITNGWRMRYYRDAAVWNDGPTTPGGQYDIQGVGCHEFGHALGLGHTTTVGATMEAAVGSPGVSLRSIQADDIAGVQGVYLVATAAKPIISNVTVNPGQVVIDGVNFALSGNEVWWTQTGVGGTGDPVKSTSVTSNGFQIILAIPAAAGAGDLLVRIPGSGNDRLSNAWPVQTNTNPPCNPPYNTCFSSPNTFDPNGAVMNYFGTQSVANNDFVLLCTGCPPNTAGLFYYGPTEIYAPFGNGYRCVGNPTVRFSVIHADGFGDAVRPLDLNNLPGGAHINAGDVKYFQFWYRNPAAGGAGYNLSDALAVPFCM